MVGGNWMPRDEDDQLGSVPVEGPQELRSPFRLKPSQQEVLRAELACRRCASGVVIQLGVMSPLEERFSGKQYLVDRLCGLLRLQQPLTELRSRPFFRWSSETLHLEEG